MNIRYPIYEGVYRILTMYFLQILPCHASVIGKKDRTYKPGR